MYKLAIFEDDEIFAEDLKNTCHDILNTLHIKAEITCFSGRGAFLEAYTEGFEPYDICLIDNFMDDDRDSGIKLARQIQDANKNTVIIFITSYDYALKSIEHEIESSAYLMKPVNPDKLKKKIAKAYKKKIKPQYLSIAQDKITKCIQLDDILYLQTVGKKVLVALSDNEIFYYSGKLDDLSSELPESCFYQCHKSYMVNMAYVSTLQLRSKGEGYKNTNLKGIRILGHEFILKNGQAIPISRKNKDTAQGRFAQHLSNDRI